MRSRLSLPRLTNRPQARVAAEAVEVEYEVLDAVVKCVSKAHRRTVHRKYIREAHRAIFIYDWEIGDEAATDAGNRQCSAMSSEMDITNNRLSPNPMEPRSAVLRSFNSAEDHYTLYTTSPKPARGAAGACLRFYQVAPETQTARDCTRCGRWRFRREDLYLSRKRSPVCGLR